MVMFQKMIQAIVKKQHETLRWYELVEVAQAAKLNTHIISFIVGSLFFRSTENVREDVGMNLISESKADGGQLCLPAYSCRTPTGWKLSNLAVDALRDYVAQWPELFEALAYRKVGDKDLEANWVFWQKRDVAYSFQKLVKYCKSCPFKKLRLAPANHMALTPASIIEIGAAVDAAYRCAAERPVQVELIKGHKWLYRAEDSGSRPPPELFLPPGEDLMVGQRVVCIKPHGRVPCGSKGTVVGIYGTGHSQELELLLDEDSFGATDLHGRAPGMRGLQGSTSLFMPLQPHLSPIPYAPEPDALEDAVAFAPKSKGTMRAAADWLAEGKQHSWEAERPNLAGGDNGAQELLRMLKSTPQAHQAEPASISKAAASTKARNNARHKNDAISAATEAGIPSDKASSQSQLSPDAFPSEQTLPLPRFNAGLASSPAPAPATRSSNAPANSGAANSGRWNGASDSRNGGRKQPQPKRQSRWESQNGSQTYAGVDSGKGKQEPEPEWADVFDDLLALGKSRQKH